MASNDRALRFFSTEVNKPFSQITKEDITGFLGRDIKQGTRNMYIENLKSFFTWYEKKELIEDLRQKPVDDFIDTKELWTDQEIKQLIEVATNDHDKCCVAMMFDLAIERKCIPSLNTGDVEINENAVYVTVVGKRRGNRQRRRLQCSLSAP